jgi:hypothetical protein
MPKRSRAKRIRTLTVVILLGVAVGPLASCLSLAEAPSPPFRTVIEAFDVLGPMGNRIYGQIRRPDPAIYPGAVFPAVILVSGGMVRDEPNRGA